jgi:hypothetical protein
MLVTAIGACGGVQIPEHNGYKSANAKPWRHAKPLKWDAKMEAKVDGDLSYPDMRRAAWFSLDTPSTGAFDIRLEITPPGDATNEDFDLGMEVYDGASYKQLSRSDLDESDAHELNKKQALVDLPMGHYLIHLYLEGRLDTADYSLHVTFKPTAPTAAKSDFPVQVAYPPVLPQVPLDDDTPKSKLPPPPRPTPGPGPRHQQPKEPEKPVVAAVTARILGISVVGKGTQITVGRGTSSGAQAGYHAKIQGVAGSFTLDSCNDRTCTSVVSATPDQIKNAGSVVITP